MLPANITQIITRLSKDDIRKLGDFVRSPYFNSRESLCLLYDEVLKQYPALKPEKFEYKTIYQKIFGGKDYKEQTIKNLYSDFGSLLKKFIAHERICTNEVDYNNALINGYKDKKCFEQSNKAIASGKKKIEFENEEQYLISMVQWESLRLSNLHSLNEIDLDEYYIIYNSISNNILSLFLGTFYACARHDYVLTKAHVIQKDIEATKNAFLNSFDAEKFFKENNSYSAFEKIHYLGYKFSIAEITESQYTEIKNIIIENIDTLTLSFKIQCWEILLDLIILKLVPKDKKYYQEAFKINDYFVKLNLYPNKFEHLPISLFRNIYGTAIMIKEYEWGKKFVDDYSQYLAEDSRENEMNYSLGRLNFQMKNYEKSLEYLNKVIFQHVLEKINVRFYYLMNYIELKSYISAIAMVNAIKQFYIESKEIPEMFAVLIENSLKFFREIIRVEENNKKLDYAVYKEAQNAGRYYQKQYILEKMQSLL